MAAEVSAALERQLQDAPPEHREAVLITLAEGADPEELRDAGVETTFVTRGGNIVAGRMTAEALSHARELGGVLKIESDDQMHALGE